MEKSSKRRLHWVIIALAIAAIPCFAADSAVLRNGFSIRHERRTVLGLVTRLYVNGDGSSYVDIPTQDIDHFEAAPAEPAAARVSLQAPTTGSRPPVSRSSHAQLSAADLNQLVSASSDHYRLDPDLVSSVIKAESGFNVRAVSRKGAQGLMQLMPETAMKLGVPDAFDPQANVEGGTRYLRELLERYNFDLVKALAAYNAGPQRVEQFGGVPPYYETKAYVARIVRDFNKKVAQRSAAVTPKSAAGKKTIPAQQPSSAKAAKSKASQARSRVQAQVQTKTDPQAASQ